MFKIHCINVWNYQRINTNIKKKENMPKGTTPSTLISETQCFSSRKKKALLRVYTYQTWNLSGVTQSQGLGNFPCKAVSSQKDALQIFGTHPPNSQIRGVWRVPEARTQGHLPSCKLYMPFEFQCVYLWTTHLLRKKTKEIILHLIVNGERNLDSWGVIPHCGFTLDECTESKGKGDAFTCE